MNKTYEDLMNEAKQALIDNDSLFVACIDELDSWNGYADGFRCFDMCELNELFCDTKVGDFFGMICCPPLRYIMPYILHYIFLGCQCYIWHHIQNAQNPGAVFYI